MPLYWIVNANNKEDFCQEKFNSTGLNNLGINATFASTGVLFVLIGANFGQSFAINFVRSVQWSHTPLWKRLVRSLLGLSLAIGVTESMALFTNKMTDFASQYFYSHLLTNLVLSFFIFGLYPVICSKCGLMISAEDFKQT